MATAITSIIDNLYTLISGTLTSYTELSDPYELENNTELFLKKGFGISVEAADNAQELSESCHRYIRRQFTFKLTNKITTTRENTTSIKSLQKSILEDQELVLQAIYNDNTLSGVAIDSDFTSDGGIQYLDIERTKYFVLETTVEVLFRKQV